MGSNYSAVKIARSTKQPSGGYLPVSNMNKIIYKDHKKLHNKMHGLPNVVGFAVECFTAIMLDGNNRNDIFNKIMRNIALYPMNLIPKSFKYDDISDLVEDLLYGINKIDNISALNAYYIGILVTFAHNPKYPLGLFLKDYDYRTIENIKTMVKRTLFYLNIKDYSYILHSTSPVNCQDYFNRYCFPSAECDFITNDSIIDIKAKKYPINKSDTLQLLIYYVLSMYNGNNIKSIEIFNPRTNILYYKNTDEIDSDIINEIKGRVINHNCFYEQNRTYMFPY